MHSDKTDSDQYLGTGVVLQRTQTQEVIVQMQKVKSISDELELSTCYVPSYMKVETQQQ